MIIFGDKKIYKYRNCNNRTNNSEKELMKMTDI